MCTVFIGEGGDLISIVIGMELGEGRNTILPSNWSVKFYFCLNIGVVMSVCRVPGMVSYKRYQ